jgi:hypothetical protein
MRGKERKTGWRGRKTKGKGKERGEKKEMSKGYEMSLGC